VRVTLIEWRERAADSKHDGPINLFDQPHVSWRRAIRISDLSTVMVGSWPTMVITGNGESGLDSGEGAFETATTSKEGSRRVNYSLPTRRGSDDKSRCQPR